MKRATREWLYDVCYVRDGAADCANDALDSDERQRAEIRDLKARLAAVALIGVASTHGDGGEYLRSKAFGKAVRRITDLSNKEWSKP